MVNDGQSNIPFNLSKINVDNCKKLLELQALQFISKLYNSSTLPRSHVQMVIEATTELLSGNFVISLKESVLNTLLNKSYDKEDIDKLGQLFEMFQNPFHNLSSEYLRLKAFEKTKSLLQPIQYVIGTKYDTKDHLYKSIDVTAQFIPLRIVFKKFFEMPNTFDIVTKYVDTLKAEPNNVTNIMQTSFWQNIEHKYEEKVVFPIYMYYDDYETGNPLGSHSGLHKLGAVYISIGCLPLQYSGLLENIFLALLFHSSDHKEFGTEATFKILIDELLFLETEGIQVNTPNHGNVTIYFVLTLILGDNLGLHSVMGFSENFNSRYFCRFCKVDKTSTHSLIIENKTLLQTLNNYNEDVLSKNLSISGIREECIFNCLPNFHVVINPSIDVMHDIYEGVCQYDMLHILKYFIFIAKLFSINTLNFCLKLFTYEPEMGNRPPLLSMDFQNKNKLSMSASEMICFVRIFSLVIGDLVLENDEVWKFYLSLRNIIDIVSSKNITSSDICRLECLISEHHHLYITLFNDTLEPKHHHLIHYPSIIQKVRPPANISSMRFESKHRESKLTANITCCRKNITRSLSLKHQLKFCFRLMASKGFDDDIITGPGKSNSFTDIVENETFPSSEGYTLKWIQIYGIKYSSNSSLTIIVGSHYLMPVFGIIKKIIINKHSQVCILYTVLQTLHFDEHYHAYEVKESKVIKHIEAKQLMCSPCLPFLCRMASGKLYVSSRRAI
ncbi:hypothetical protein ILUMI_21266 [Ignelater luminosus]|uniref:Uncharacterized protein n=1 Tax=Ignelater luminosus TaxID=2038154 RepID=A0A8K0FY33_IGNLU|nr:hypothetical protein ILUMI_21266 [Ignelater luminosus]